MNVVIKKYFLKISDWNKWLGGKICAPQYQYAVLFLIVFLGIILRLCYWYFNQPIPARDGIGYAAQMDLWYRHGFDAIGQDLLSRSTFVPMFLQFAGMLLMHCNLSQYASGLSVNMILGNLLPVIIFGCGKKLWPEAVWKALLAAFFVAIQPSLIEYSTDILRETSYLFFTAYAFYFWLAVYKEKHYWPAMWVGFMIALATLCRYEGFELYPMMLLSIAIWVFLKRVSLKQGFLMLLMAIGGSLLSYAIFFIVAGIDMKYVWAWGAKIFRYMGLA